MFIALERVLEAFIRLLGELKLFCESVYWELRLRVPVMAECGHSTTGTFVIHISDGETRERIRVFWDPHQHRAGHMVYQGRPRPNPYAHLLGQFGPAQPKYCRECFVKEVRQDGMPFQYGYTLDKITPRTKRILSEVARHSHLRVVGGNTPNLGRLQVE